jgi:hypothetical protein
LIVRASDRFGLHSLSRICDVLIGSADRSIAFTAASFGDEARERANRRLRESK